MLAASALLSGGTVLTSGCKPTLPERTATERAVDTKLSEAVKTAFESSASFKFPDVQVAAFNGKVQLSGFVVGDDQKQSAAAIAKAVPGVMSVENEIALKK